MRQIEWKKRYVDKCNFLRLEFPFLHWIWGKTVISVHFPNLKIISPLYAHKKNRLTFYKNLARAQARFKRNFTPERLFIETSEKSRSGVKLTILFSDYLTSERLFSDVSLKSASGVKWSNGK